MKIYSTIILVCTLCFAPIAGFAQQALGKSIGMMATTLLETAGYQLDGPIREIVQYKVAIANVADPHGNHFELVERQQ